MPNKHWIPSTIKALLVTSNKAVERAIVALYRRQTSSEQVRRTTTKSNSVGFSAAHASKGTYYARWILSGRCLTGYHLANARKIAMHYTSQLADETADRLERQAIIEEPQSQSRNERDE